MKQIAWYDRLSNKCSSKVDLSTSRSRRAVRLVCSNLKFVSRKGICFKRGFDIALIDLYDRLLKITTRCSFVFFVECECLSLLIFLLTI